MATSKKAKSSNKTTETDEPIAVYLSKLGNDAVREETKQIIDLMQTATGEAPKMWGPSIVGFGTHHYKYESGREGDTCAVGFAARKGKFALYLELPQGDREAQLAELGKVASEGGCIWVKHLADLNQVALIRLVKAAHKSRKNV
ncbi:MAG TPA: DUF1801 domain-containing protein [Thermoflexales bacterium]|nr:DUF1801 domain-containing protein [Thermoflexales bacterium]HQW34618.1 DUF1801 domain-containing protein [Thermoflexales bacterium]